MIWSVGARVSVSCRSPHIHLVYYTQCICAVYYTVGKIQYNSHRQTGIIQRDGPLHAGRRTHSVKHTKSLAASGLVVAKLRRLHINRQSTIGHRQSIITLASEKGRTQRRCPTDLAPLFFRHTETMMVHFGSRKTTTMSPSRSC